VAAAEDHETPFQTKELRSSSTAMQNDAEEQETAICPRSKESVSI
jgi:hypothetical protein